METFWNIVFREKGDRLEQTEPYDDFDDARADFLHMTQEHPEDFEYVVLQEIETNFTDYENIQIKDQWLAE